jgi:Fibrinogen beta and gamma chains, C-terminal globular domain
VDGYSGNAGDALLTTTNSAWTASGMSFTTSDVDNDRNSGENCVVAINGSGGWWFNWGSVSLLNIDSAAVWEPDGPEATYDVTQSRIMMKLV